VISTCATDGAPDCQQCGFALPQQRGAAIRNAIGCNARCLLVVPAGGNVAHPTPIVLDWGERVVPSRFGPPAPDIDVHSYLIVDDTADDRARRCGHD
jgi:hypothetical protein